MIKVNDFVILLVNTSGLETNSVGFVKDIKGKKAKVFLLAN